MIWLIEICGETFDGFGKTIYLLLSSIQYPGLVAVWTGTQTFTAFLLLSLNMFVDHKRFVFRNPPVVTQPSWV